MCGGRPPRARTRLAREVTAVKRTLREFAGQGVGIARIRSRSEHRGGEPLMRKRTINIYHSRNQASSTSPQYALS